MLYSSFVSKPNPVTAGFSEVFRCPSLVFAEIAWRWCFWAAFWILLAGSFLEYLKSLPVSSVSRLMWKTGLPPLMIQTLGNSVQGSGYKFFRIAAVLLPGLVLLWTAAASAGRVTILRALVPNPVIRFRTVFALAFLRAVLFLAASFAIAGVYFASARAYWNAPGKLPHVERATMIVIIAGGLVFLFWMLLNWLLRFAPILAANGSDALSAIAEAARTFMARPWALIAMSVLIDALHVVFFALFVYGVLFSFAFAGLLPGKLFLLLLLLIVLLYSAFIDWLRAARLAGYVAVVSGEGLFARASAPDCANSLPETRPAR